MKHQKLFTLEYNHNNCDSNFSLSSAEYKKGLKCSHQKQFTRPRQMLEWFKNEAIVSDVWMIKSVQEWMSWFFCVIAMKKRELLCEINHICTWIELKSEKSDDDTIKKSEADTFARITHVDVFRAWVTDNDNMTTSKRRLCRNLNWNTFQRYFFIIQAQWCKLESSISIQNRLLSLELRAVCCLFVIPCFLVHWIFQTFQVS